MSLSCVIWNFGTGDLCSTVLHKTSVVSCSWTVEITVAALFVFFLLPVSIVRNWHLMVYVSANPLQVVFNLSLHAIFPFSLSSLVSASLFIDLFNYVDESTIATDYIMSFLYSPMRSSERTFSFKRKDFAGVCFFANEEIHFNITVVLISMLLLISIPISL